MAKSIENPSFPIICFILMPPVIVMLEYYGNETDPSRKIIFLFGLKLNLNSADVGLNFLLTIL